MKKIDAVINLEIAGLGIIVYCPRSTKHIEEGSNYFVTNYMQPAQVASHVMKGSITTFCVSSPGSYSLKIMSGYPTDKIIGSYMYSIRLGLEVFCKRIIFRDLYDLMDWRQEYPIDQSVEVENGFYHLTVYTNLPESGKRGDNQRIAIWFEKLTRMPELRWDGVPILC